MMFAKQSRKPESVSDYPITGMPNISTLVNRYNALVLQLSTKKSDEEIFTSGLFRTTQINMEGTYGDEDDVISVYKLGANYGRAMRDLMLPAKISLLSVCEGHFVKHPKKSYI